MLGTSVSNNQDQARFHRAGAVHPLDVAETRPHSCIRSGVMLRVQRLAITYPGANSILIPVAHM